MITVDLLVEGGIFALLQHGLNPTFWTYILLIRHKKTQKYDFLFIKLVSAFGPGGGRTTFSIVMVKVQLTKKAKKSTFSLMDFKKILCMYSIVRVERLTFCLKKFSMQPPLLAINWCRTLYKKHPVLYRNVIEKSLSSHD